MVEYKLKYERGRERGRKWIRKLKRRGAGRAEKFEKRKRNSE